MRATIVVLVSMITFAAASFFGGMLRFGWGISGIGLRSLALWLVGGGCVAGSLVGLVVAHATAPSTPRTRRAWSLGTTIGVFAGTLVGLGMDACVSGPKVSHLGDPANTLMCASMALVGPWPWHYVAAVTVLAIAGGGLGGVLGLVTARARQRAG